MTKPKSKPATGKSLSAYIQDTKRAACAVCALPEEVRQQIRAASRNKIPRVTILEWLTAEHAATIAVEDLTRHYTQRH